MELDQEMLDLYRSFVLERHAIYIRRTRNSPLIPDTVEPVWTNDDTLRANKFTNVYRVLDHGSQYLLKELLNTAPTPADVFLRALLYRYTNRPEPWDFFRQEHGRFPLVEDLLHGRVSDSWESMKVLGKPIFGSAYKIFQGSENRGMSRLEWLLSMATKAVDSDISERLLRTDSVRERVGILQTIPRCAGFMSMQVVTDLGYSDDYASDENEFVIAGPGSLRGLAVVFGKSADPVKMITEVQRWSSDLDPALGLHLPTSSLDPRPPSLMDIQNTFCEFSKYYRYRVMGQSGRTKVFRASRRTPLVPTLPNHW